MAKQIKAEDFVLTKPSVKPDYLNDNQWEFCEAYLKLGNIRDAVVEAGYSPKSASTQGTHLMQNPYVKQYLAERYEMLNKMKVANADEVLEFLTDVVRGKVKDQFDLDPSLADRLKASDMLLKRVFDTTGKLENTVHIINNIPYVRKSKVTTSKNDNGDDVVEVDFEEGDE